MTLFTESIARRATRVRIVVSLSVCGESLPQSHRGTGGLLMALAFTDSLGDFRRRLVAACFGVGAPGTPMPGAPTFFTPEAK
jgi:hypothetical protein